MANRLKEVRLEKKLTQKEVSRQTGIPVNTYSNYERGDREPKLETWKKLADYFDVSVGYLQGLDNFLPKKIHKNFLEFDKNIKNSSNTADNLSAYNMWILQNIDNTFNMGNDYYKYFNDYQLEKIAHALELVYQAWLPSADYKVKLSDEDKEDLNKFYDEFSMLIELVTDLSGSIFIQKYDNIPVEEHNTKMTRKQLTSVISNFNKELKSNLNVLNLNEMTEEEFQKRYENDDTFKNYIDNLSKNDDDK
ncbi:XRE family transcriptional regulator [Weissella paramesenteroides]|uniref:helix-turn-helix domain-containing protein n=1 Tax=Weissella paramesenteroides TaxID=1249 RepID=UPI00223B4CFE|nr:helix-turn-helix transcriptional regulator [Weissella paramesenteroides]MCS9985137.1 XRE family transcriptional regulator [Weissella paramesenteroides]MCS9998004.1 XRE family transcriptional regulator [Weissella paramesenteroides]MCT0260769.1 XRE family transcriptional regulator [Weissella paramesenteroides]